MRKKRLVRMCAMMAAALVLVLLIQWAASALPIWDTTAKSLMTPSQDAKTVAQGIAIPTSILLVAENIAEVEYVQIYLQKLAALSKNLRFEHVLPTDSRLSAYSGTALADGSIVITSAKRFAILSQIDLYEYDIGYDYYSGSYVYTDVRFAVEDRVTRALSYVTADLPKAYILTGHGEGEIALSLRAAMQDAMIGLEPLNLAEREAVPEDAQILIISAPAEDLNADEFSLLLGYLEAGGNLFVTTDVTVGSLWRLSTLLEAYGMRMNEGLVLEGESSRYLSTYKQYVLPTISQDHESVQTAALAGISVTTPLSHAIDINASLRDTLTVMPLLTTGESSYLKTNITQLTTLDQEAGDQIGPFDVAVVAEETVEGGASKLIWIASGSFLSDNAFQASDGANAQLLGEMLSWMTPLPASASYAAKSMMYSYLYLNQNTQIALFALWIGLPAILLVITALQAYRRRPVRNS